MFSNNAFDNSSLMNSSKNNAIVFGPSGNNSFVGILFNTSGNDSYLIPIWNPRLPENLTEKFLMS